MEKLVRIRDYYLLWILLLKITVESMLYLSVSLLALLDISW
jgi:hypothetical protein